MCAILFWSTTVAFSRSLTEQLGVFSAGAWVYLVAGVVGCGVLAAQGRLVTLLRQSDRRYLVGCGSLVAVYTVLLYAAVGLAKTGGQVITATVANYLWPGLTLVFSVPLLGFRANYLLLGLGTALGVAGVGLAQGAGGADLLAGEGTGGAVWPMVFGLAGAVCWGLYSNLCRRWGRDGSDGAMAVFLLGTGLVLLLVRWLRDEHSAWDGRAIGEASYLILFPTLLAYLFWDVGMRRGNLPLLAAVSYLTPVLSIGVSAVYLGLPVSPAQWLGGLAVVAGAVLSRVSIRSEASP
jgi:drug/metabolite transporter (DMT)-like permease